MNELLIYDVAPWDPQWGPLKQPKWVACHLALKMLKVWMHIKIYYVLM